MAFWKTKIIETENKSVVVRGSCGVGIDYKGALMDFFDRSILYPDDDDYTQLCICQNS